MLTDTQLGTAQAHDRAEQHRTEQGGEKSGADSDTGLETEVHVGDGNKRTSNGTEQHGADRERLVILTVNL